MHNYIKSALRTLHVELEQINKLNLTLESEEFIQAVDLIYSCKGKIIFMGVGKSGHIAKKIAASFASTGTPSFFVHPCEAGHGDAGMITTGDLVIYISNSGESHELNSLIPYLQLKDVQLLGVTNNQDSTLGRNSNLTLLLRVDHEACPLNLAPTASTTNTLVLGDCLTVALIDKRGITQADFATSHPFGALGRRLLVTNEQLMRTGEDVPMVTADTLISDALVKMSNKGLGCVLVVPDLKQKEKALLGIFTDGDLRRFIAQHKDIYTTQIQYAMTKEPSVGKQQSLAYETLQLLEQKKINVLPIVNNEQKIVGILSYLDLIKSGI